MSGNRIILLVAAMFVLGLVAWFAFRSSPPHEHEFVPSMSAEGGVYWTCPMHPQVHLDATGDCPICGMKLVKRVQPPSEAKVDREVLYWYDPMRPDVHFDKPGKSPFMDMQLVPKYASARAGAGQQSPIIQIDPRMAQNLGMRTALVTRGAVALTLNAVGSVTVDETRIFAIESRAAGWVERLHVRAEGQPVTRGQAVASIYSPDLYAAQSELALAAKSGDQALIDAARQRLALLGVSASQIEQVIRRGEAARQVAVIAPSDGVITELNVREGPQVAPGMPLMRIADLSRVWITIELPETQAGLIRAGEKATARLRGIPGKTFSGEVEYVYPRLEASTRTVSARIAFENPKGELKPGMYADVSLEQASHDGQDGDQQKALLVPSEAIIRTGTRTVVIVEEAAGRYRPAVVELGPERQEQTVVLAGLREGERVVVSGQFLIDSEASLQGAFDRLGSVPAGEQP
jgi:membrane fusion protein, copper/silver efflux system